jgi:hypothetical protein
MSLRKTVPVSERALIQRINRKLAEEDQHLRKARGAQAQSNFGSYYIVNQNRNWVVAHARGVDDGQAWLEDLGRELGVLSKWEHVEAAA